MMSSELCAPGSVIEPIPFGRYALLDRLNVGGMAEVFLGKSVGIHDVERFVAIKRILPAVADDPEFEHMFIDEAKLSVQLTHANVAQTFELGRIGPSLYIAMEYVSGVDLRLVWEHMQDGGEIPISALVYIVAKLCEGLDYAHRKTDAEGRALGIVHRDISPQNIMVAYDGQVKVIDFGIAKAKVRASQTRVGILKGKFAYMSPEQVAGAELDARSDVFSVGILLYELLTKSRLFKSDSDFMTLERARHVELYPPRLVNPKLPRELEHILLKTLARDREERTGSVEALHEMLMRFAIQSGASCSARDLSALLQREFRSAFDKERERLVSFLDLKIDPQVAAVALAKAEARKESALPQIAAAQGAQIASVETRIADLRGQDASDRTALKRAPTDALSPRLQLTRRAKERSDTRNIRLGQEPDPTRLLPPGELVPEPPKKKEEVSASRRPMAHRSSVRAPEKAVRRPVTKLKETRPGARNMLVQNVGQEGSNESRSAARVPEPRFGRQSVLVWLSTAVAIVLVVLAFWLSVQLNPNAKLVIDVEPPNAELLVNAKTLGTITRHGGFEVTPGEVLIEVRAIGYCPWYRHLKLSAKETFSTRVILQQKTNAACPPP